jgi:hypothetical protein
MDPNMYTQLMNSKAYGRKNDRVEGVANLITLDTEAKLKANELPPRPPKQVLFNQK